MSSEASDSTGPPDPRLVATAYHEAGHAVMAILLGREVHKVTIARGQMHSGVRLGICELRKGRSKASNDWLEDEVLILLAGMVAEARLSGVYCEQGAAQDLAAVRRLLSQTRASSERQLQRLEQRMLDKAEHLMADEVALRAVELVAKELLEKIALSGRAVRHWLELAKRSK